MQANTLYRTSLGGFTEMYERFTIDRMFQAFFIVQIVAYFILLCKACVAACSIYGKKYSALFFKREVAWILTFSSSTILSAFIIVSGSHENAYLRVTVAFLLSLSYLSNDVVLFLYVHRIWVTSVDAATRSWNFYIENFSDKTLEEREKDKIPSAKHRPSVKWWKNLFVGSEAIVIIAFCGARMYYLP